MGTKRTRWEWTSYVPNTIIADAGKREESGPHTVSRLVHSA